MQDYSNLSKIELLEKVKAQRFVLIKLNKQIKEQEQELLSLKYELNKLLQNKQ